MGETIRKNHFNKVRCILHTLYFWKDKVNYIFWDYIVQIVFFCNFLYKKCNSLHGIANKRRHLNETRIQLCLYDIKVGFL